MKKLIFIIFLSPVILIQCGQQKNVIQKNLPFHITEKTYQNWIGGVEGSNRTYLRLKGDIKPSNIQFVSIFFHNREQKVNALFQGDTFTIENNFFQKKEDMNMTGDPAGEYGNKPPVDQKENDFPFDLKDNEAVLYYHVNGKDYYYKVTDIKKLDNRILE